jgi:hypothetical protein
MSNATITRFSFRNCTEITEICTLKATTYGYYPNLAANSLFIAIFAILTIAHFPLVFKYKNWTYSFAVGAACLIEAIGYGGRVMLHNNPWSDDGFRVQVVCIIIAPSFLAAAIYLTVRHLIVYYGPEYSKLKPVLYTWVFIGADIFSIMLQAAGGGIASSADKGDRKKVQIGNNVIIAGIAFQVVTMALCGLLTLDFALRYIRRTKAAGKTINWTSINRPGIFCITSFFAYVFVLIRCIYRIPEMAGGWGGPKMRHEAEFMVLDGA